MLFAGWAEKEEKWGGQIEERKDISNHANTLITEEEKGLSLILKAEREPACHTWTGRFATHSAFKDNMYLCFGIRDKSKVIAL